MFNLRESPRFSAPQNPTITPLCGLRLFGSVLGFPCFMSIWTTWVLAFAFAFRVELPYTFMVVEMLLCRMSFCCTRIEAPVSS